VNTKPTVTAVTGFRTSRGGFYEDQEVANYFEAEQNAVEAVQNSLYFKGAMTSKEIIRLVTNLNKEFIALTSAYAIYERYQELETFAPEPMKGPTDATCDLEQDAIEEKAKNTAHERRTGRIPPSGTDTKDKNKSVEDAGDTGDT
jgi:hypothetical protein